MTGISSLTFDATVYYVRSAPLLGDPLLETQIADVGVRPDCLYHARDGHRRSLVGGIGAVHHQRRHDRAGHLVPGSMGSTAVDALRLPRHDGLSLGQRDPAGHLWSTQHQIHAKLQESGYQLDHPRPAQGVSGRHRLCLSHGGHLRRDLGSDLVDLPGRDLPQQGPRQGRVVGDGDQLELELRARVCGAAAALAHQLEDVPPLRRLQPSGLCPHVPGGTRDQGQDTRGDGRGL